MHASLVLWKNKGILFKGKSGSGKSELALKFIENKNAVLVADDVVALDTRNNMLLAARRSISEVCWKLEMWEFLGMNLKKKQKSI